MRERCPSSRRRSLDSAAPSMVFITWPSSLDASMRLAHNRPSPLPTNPLRNLPCGYASYSPRDISGRAKPQDGYPTRSQALDRRERANPRHPRPWCSQLASMPHSGHVCTLDVSRFSARHWNRHRGRRLRCMSASFDARNRQCMRIAYAWLMSSHLYLRCWVEATDSGDARS